MRISASTVAFPDMPLTELPGRAAALSLDGLAPTFGRHGSLTLDASEGEIRDFHARCRELGVSISALYGYAGRGLLADPTARAPDLDLAKRCIDMAARLEAPLCRVFAGLGQPTEDLIDRFVDAFQPAAAHAAQASVTLGFPTHHDFAYDPTSCRRLVSGFGPGRAGIIFNGPSMELDGIDPVEALRAMRDIVIQAELKDWRREGAHDVPAPIGKGEAAVRPIVKELDAIGFDGWVTLHHLKQHHPELPDLEPATVEAVRALVTMGPT